MNRSIRAAALAAAALWATPVVAQDVTGAIEGTLNGTPHSWHVLVENGESNSSWMDMGGILMVSVFGHADRTSLLDGTDALNVTLTLMQREGGPVPIEVEVLHYAGASMTLYANDIDSAPPADLALERIAVEGEDLHVKGRVTAQVFRVVDLAEMSFDESDRIEVVASFEAVLPR